MSDSIFVGHKIVVDAPGVLAALRPCQGYIIPLDILKLKYSWANDGQRLRCVKNFILFHKYDSISKEWENQQELLRKIYYHEVIWKISSNHEAGLAYIRWCFSQRIHKNKMKRFFGESWIFRSVFQQDTQSLISASRGSIT